MMMTHDAAVPLLLAIAIITARWYQKSFLIIF
jgi:hypothetical protein